MSDVVNSWVGASGAAYRYHVYELGARVPAYSGNYIYCKYVDDKDWAPIYFGEGDLSVCAGASADILKCIEMKGATHVHLRCNLRLQDRLKELEDLLKGFNNAFAPQGCHPDRHENCVWIGKSEAKYVFFVYEKNELIPPRQGIYICARRTIDHVWTPLAIGQGDLSLANPDIARWSQSPECTHIHRRIEMTESDRVEGRDDLAENYLQFVPELQKL